MLLGLQIEASRIKAEPLFTACRLIIVLTGDIQSTVGENADLVEDMQLPGEEQEWREKEKEDGTSHDTTLHTSEATVLMKFLLQFVWKNHKFLSKISNT